jgi:hypothetical protein
MMSGHFNLFPESSVNTMKEVVTRNERIKVNNDVQKTIIPL